MARKKTYEEINEKIKKGNAVVVTAEEIIGMVDDMGVEAVCDKVDVVTTATFGPMCSSGAFLNFGHADPPIKMTKIWLNDVPVYAGLAAVDGYVGATELSETRFIEYGGAHVIQDLLDGKRLRLRAIGYGTDCYPLKEVETYLTLDDLNEAYLFNPRNVYQNYSVATNSSSRTIYTYMGTLLPRFRNATYSTSGELSPLLNDPYYRTIGIGTRIFLGGGVGYVAWSGTQHSPSKERLENGVPVSPAGTLALMGDLKQMSSEYIRAAIFHKYGVSMFVGVGVPIPILDEDMVRSVSVRNRDIYTTIVDYGVQKRERPTYGRVNYEQLRSGAIEIRGKRVSTAPLSSLYKARQITDTLKTWIKKGDFLLQEPIQVLPGAGSAKSLNIVNEEGI